MASCITPQWSGSSTPQARLTVTLNTSKSDGDTAALDWKLEYVAHGYAAHVTDERTYTVTINGSVITGTFAINGVKNTTTIKTDTIYIAKATTAKSISFSVSFPFNLTWSGVYGGTKTASGSISIPAKTSYTVSYNKNGGSTTPSNQIKWFGTNITLANAISRDGYTFKNWNTKADGTGTAYSACDTYSTNAAVTLYAQWTANKYTITYNPNGGNLGSVPATQQKTHGVPTTLSTYKPTRTNYIFLGWSTSSSATAATYAAGESYTANANITLYAVWQLAYKKPRIKSFKVFRCNSNNTLDDSGTKFGYSFDWETDLDVQSIKITWKPTNGNTEYDVKSKESVSGRSGSCSMYGALDGFDLDTTYTFTLTISDGIGERYSIAAATLSGSKYTIDFKAGGKGVAIGKAAELENVFDVGLTTRFLGNRYCMSSPGQDAASGYVLMAKIKIINVYVDSPITFVLTQRSQATPMTVHVLFDSSSSTTQSSLVSFRYEGTNYGAFLVHMDAMDWYLYVQKSVDWDDITVQDWYTSKRMDDRIEVTFPGSFVTEMPQGLEGWHRAIPAVLRSVIDCVMPVGFILTLYSHADPNTMYPGTTWKRIENAFLWGCDSSGTIGQTGGEKTHTLTINEMPKHDHGIRWTDTDGNAGGASQEHPMIRYGETGTGYAGAVTVETGGGAAHNNMPPYVQVSIWRRTT